MRNIDTAECLYTSKVWPDGRVGYRVSWKDGRPNTFLYFNPSGEVEDGKPDVFVYIGSDKVEDATPVVYINTDPREYQR